MQNDSILYSEWLEKANSDIKWADNSFEGGFYDGVCLLSQQIIEKTLKAYLIFQKQKPKKIHDLKSLLENSIKFDDGFEKFVTDCNVIKNYYIGTRYPGDQLLVDEKDAVEALSAAKEIFNFVKQKIGEK